MKGPHRVALGLLIFVMAAWMSPYMADVLDVPSTIVYLTFGGTLSFVAGMLFYSGVRTWRRATASAAWPPPSPPSEDGQTIPPTARYHYSSSWSP
ncbi:MAG: hypothetical protein J5674_06150 [Candidatus Methanomethylophilaceae archaeon]|nr:hypothetical protein [Candidatus Methanomethylophilaceae archaeon]